MRIAHSSVYDNFLNRQAQGTNELNKVSDELSSGKKIKLAQENPNINISSLRLKDKLNTIEQAHSVSQRAREHTLNSDTTLGQMTKALDEFKVKLAYAANEEHTDKNYEIISNELKALKNHMMSLANTSVNGKFIFSGSKVDFPPIKADNSYGGNGESLSALIGSHNKIDYNVTGIETFFGRDNDIHKTISTNLPIFNQSKLHPDVMTRDRKEVNPEEVYIKSSDLIRDMLGDNDDIKDNGANAIFFIKGRKTDGTSFKSKISLNLADDIQTLMNRIEKVYEGSVEVRLNNHGQIELKDKTSGQSLLDFHMFGAVDREGDGENRADVDDISEIMAKSNIDIIDFHKSAFTTTKNAYTTNTVQDKYQKNKFELNTIFNNKVKPAMPNDSLQEILGKNISTILVTGTDTEGDDVQYLFDISANQTLTDLVSSIKSKFGNVDVKLDKTGRVIITDLDLKEGQKSDLEISLTAHKLDEKTKKEFAENEKLKDERDKANYVLNNLKPSIYAFSTNESISSDNVYFKKTISGLTSNISQIVKSTDLYATEDTKLIDVAGADLDGAKFKMDIVDVQGREQHLLIEMAKDRVIFGYDEDMDGSLNGFYDRKFNVLNEKNIYTMGKMSDDPTYVANLAPNSQLEGIEYGDEVHLTSENFKTFDGSTDSIINFLYPTNLHIMKEGQEVIINGERRKVAKVNYMDIPKNIVLDEPLTHQPKINTKVTVVNRVAEADDFTKQIKFENEVPFKMDRNDKIELGGGQIATSDTITYSQLMDTISMALTGELPINGDRESYIDAVGRASSIVDVKLNQKGQIEVKDLKNSKSRMELSLSDANNNSYQADKVNHLSFNANNAFVVDEPYIDFFNQLDDTIEAVRLGLTRANGENEVHGRNKGMQNSLETVDHLSSHISKMQTQVGINTKRFDDAIARNEMLKTHVTELKSDIEDTDIAEAGMRLQQKSLGYQAMLQTIQKMNGLSLVNYMR